MKYLWFWFFYERADTKSIHIKYLTILNLFCGEQIGIMDLICGEQIGIQCQFCGEQIGIMDLICD